MSSSGSTDFSRRSLLRWAGVGVAAVAATPLLTACGNGSASGSGAVSNAGKSLAPWPAYVPNTAAHYDLAPLPNNGAPAVLRYPALPLPSSVKQTPGDGSTVTAMTFSYGAPVKLDSSNQLLAAVGKALGVTFQPNFVVDNGTSFASAQTTMQAGGSLPDLIGGTATLPGDFVEAECADLTPYLSGDAIKDYPNLASLPQRAWELSGRIGGKIYTVPIYRYSTPTQGYVADRGAWQGAGAWGPGVSTAQFLTTAQKLSTGGHFALGTVAGVPFGFPFHLGAAGVPNYFSQSGSSFTSHLDSPQFAQALGTMQQFYAKGLYNTDALTAASAEQTANYLSGKWRATFLGLGSVTTLFAQVGNQFDADILYPYGSSPGAWGGDSIFNGTAIKKGSADRVTMLLRVLDFLAAPFGSKEWELLNYGVEGVHFTRGADGSPSLPTALGKVENLTNVPFKYLIQQPQPIYQPGDAKATQTVYDAYKQQLAISITNPTLAYQSGSATWGKNNAGYKAAVNSAVADIVSGKQPLSSWGSTAAQLKTQFLVGQMITEFEQGYNAAGKG